MDDPQIKTMYKILKYSKESKQSKNPNRSATEMEVLLKGEWC